MLFNREMGISKAGLSGAMSKLFAISILVALSLLLGCQKVQRTVSHPSDVSIHDTIDAVFTASIKDSENLDFSSMTKAVDDKFKSGFIVDGKFYPNFSSLMLARGHELTRLKSQKINIKKKIITVLSPDVALITANGDFTSIAKDGQMRTGDFSWTFVYTLIDDKWNVIHYHQSSLR